MVNLSGLVDTYGVFTYKDPLIWFGAENFQNWKHREFAIKADPIAHIYIPELDKEILAERPIFTPNIFESTSIEDEMQPEEAGTEPTSLEKNTEIVAEPVQAEFTVDEEWELEKWDKLLLKMIDMARTHAFDVVQLYDRPPYWRVFTDREITEIFYDSRDNPIGCTVEWSVSMPKSDTFRFHKETLRFYDETKENNDGTALFISYGNAVGQNLGEYALEPIWSLMIHLRWMNLDAVHNSAICSGFFHFVYGDTLKDADRQDLIDSADVAGIFRAIGAKETALKAIHYNAPTNASFTLDAIDSTLLLIAGACRLPLSFFRGERVAGGMNSGMAGFVDEGKVTEKKKWIFSQFAPYIKKLVEMRWGIVIDDVVPYIKAEQQPMEFVSMPFNQNNNKNQESDNNA